MQSDELVYVGQMLDMARKGLRLVGSKSRAEYDQDETLRLALAHPAQVIGEAARRVSPEFAQAHPKIPWKAIVGMRRKVVHDYMAVDEDVVWRTVTEQLPALVNLLEDALPPQHR